MANSNSDISTSENEEEGSGELFADLPVKSKRAQAPQGGGMAPVSAAALVAPPSGQARPVMPSSSGVHSLASVPPPPPSRVSAPPAPPTSAGPVPPPSLRGAAPPPPSAPPPTPSEVEAAPLEHVEYADDNGDDATPVRAEVEGTPTVKLPDVSIVAAMTRGGVSAAPPPPPTPAPVSVPPAPVASVPVPSAPAPSAAPPVSAPPPVSTMPVLSQPAVHVAPAPAQSGSNKLIVGALVLLALVAAGLVYQQFAGGAKEGTLLTNVSGPGGAAVDKFELFVDGSRRCEASPCKVDGLSAGEHFVKVVAPGFESSSAVSVTIEGGKTRTHSVELVVDKEAKAAAETSALAAADAPAKAEPPKSDTLSVDQLGEKAGGDEKAEPAKVSAASSTKTATKAATPAKATEKAPEKADSASSEMGTLHISSTPPSNAVVDGRPIGMTPKTIRVTPGQHTVVFIGPEGRKVQGVNVKAGGTASAAVTF